MIATALVMAATLLVRAAMRRSSAATRHFVTVSGLALAVAMPWLIAVRPAMPAEIRISVPVVAAAPSVPALDWWKWISWAGSGFLAARLGLSLARAFRLRRQSKPFGDGVRTHPEILSPLTFGYLAPVILLPVDVREWPSERLKHVLSHERAHIARRDVWTALFTELACAAYWYLPFVWMLKRAIVEDRELACDDLVLAQGAAAPEYAQELLTFAHKTQAAPLAGVAMAEPYQLEKRIMSLLSSNIARGPVSRRFRAAILTGAAVLAASVVLVAQDPPLKLSEHPEVTKPRILSKVEPVFPDGPRDEKIDGTVVLETTVETDGRILVQSVKRTPDDRLSVAARESVAKWKMQPAMKDGKPVRVAATIEVNFRLK